MVKLNKIYTRTGDDGLTGLVAGPRVLKSDLRIEAVGAVDEANAAIGVARSAAAGQTKIITVLRRVQNDMFDVGSDLATPGPDTNYKPAPLRVTAQQVEWLETTIDQFNREIEPLDSFILPGGTAVASHLHLARATTRRAERAVVALSQFEDDLNPAVGTYLNRLSDLLFVLSRSANDRGRADVLWEPGRFTGSTAPTE
jgi:cob(I)alamin adenosyltransferase